MSRTPTQTPTTQNQNYVAVSNGPASLDNTSIPGSDESAVAHETTPAPALNYMANLPNGGNHIGKSNGAEGEVVTLPAAENVDAACNPSQYVDLQNYIGHLEGSMVMCSSETDSESSQDNIEFESPINVGAIVEYWDPRAPLSLKLLTTQRLRSLGVVIFEPKSNFYVSLELTTEPLNIMDQENIQFVAKDLTLYYTTGKPYTVQARHHIRLLDNKLEGNELDKAIAVVVADEDREEA